MKYISGFTWKKLSYKMTDECYFIQGKGKHLYFLCMVAFECEGNEMKVAANGIVVFVTSVGSCCILVEVLGLE